MAISYYNFFHFESHLTVYPIRIVHKKMAMNKILFSLSYQILCMSMNKKKIINLSDMRYE
jgi:hypothetical protein